MSQGKCHWLEGQRTWVRVPAVPLANPGRWIGIGPHESVFSSEKWLKFIISALLTPQVFARLL